MSQEKTLKSIFHRVQVVPTTQEVDDSQWEYIVSPRATILLTSEGRKLFERDKKIKDRSTNAAALVLELRKYKQDYRNILLAQELRENKKPPLTIRLDANRAFISKGSTGSVFKLGQTNIAVKECRSGTSLIDTISRMDVLKYAVDHSNLPAWIGMPEHYGALEYKTEKGALESFMLMQEINYGATVGDIIKDEKSDENPVTPARAQKRVKEYIGEVTDEEKEEIRQSVEEMKALLLSSIEKLKKEGKPGVEGNENYLADFKNDNILIERLKVPIEGKKFKLWIIDQ